MAEHHDVLDAQHLYCVFQRRRHAMGAAVRLENRHQIGDVAHHEQFAGPASKITSGETRNRSSRSPSRRRLAALGKFPVARLFGRQSLRGKGPVAVEQMLRNGAMVSCPYRHG
jgi:hypothetical protein